MGSEPDEKTTVEMLQLSIPPTDHFLVVTKTVILLRREGNLNSLTLDAFSGRNDERCLSGAEKAAEQ